MLLNYCIHFYYSLMKLYVREKFTIIDEDLAVMYVVIYVAITHSKAPPRWNITTSHNNFGPQIYVLMKAVTFFKSR